MHLCQMWLSDRDDVGPQGTPNGRGGGHHYISEGWSFCLAIFFLFHKGDGKLRSPQARWTQGLNRERRWALWSIQVLSRLLRHAWDAVGLSSIPGSKDFDWPTNCGCRVSLVHSACQKLEFHRGNRTHRAASGRKTCMVLKGRCVSARCRPMRPIFPVEFQL